MYSRKISLDEKDIKIPPHYSGTALRKSTFTEKRDAVGRPGVLQNEPIENHLTVHDQKKELPPREKVQVIKAEETASTPPQRHEERDNDTLFVCALLLSLIGTKGDREEDVTLLLLILALIL